MQTKGQIVCVMHLASGAKSEGMQSENRKQKIAKLMLIPMALNHCTTHRECASVCVCVCVYCLMPGPRQIVFTQQQQVNVRGECRKYEKERLALKRKLAALRACSFNVLLT